MYLPLDENNYIMVYRKLKRYKYQLTKAYIHRVNIYDFSIKTEYISLDPEGRLTFEPHYAWDGPSGPAIDTKSFMRGSLVHDGLYQLIRLDLLPKFFKSHADYELYTICIEDGMFPFRAKYVYMTVQNFADFALKPNPKENQIYTIP